MLKFVIKRKNFAAFVKDYEEKIKKSGIYLKTSRNIAEGDEINIVFQFPEEGLEISGIGEIAWVDDEVDVSGRRGFLVRNIVLTPESVDTMERYRGASYTSPQSTSYTPQQNTPTSYTPPPQNQSPQPPPSSPPTPTPPPPPQQTQQPYQGDNYYPPEYTPPPPPPPQQPPQQMPTANISVNVTSPSQPTVPPTMAIDEDLKKLRGSRGWIWVLIVIIILGGFGFWFFGMNGRQILMGQKEKPAPTPPPPPPKPQKVIIEVKTPKPITKATTKPKPKPKPRKPKKRRRIVTRPAGLKDFVYTTGANFTHLEFIFNRPYKKYVPSPLENSLNIYIPNAYNETGQDQFFISSSLIQSVVITRTEGTLTITIYPSTPTLPYYEFDRERDRLIVNFYKHQ